MQTLYDYILLLHIKQGKKTKNNLKIPLQTKLTSQFMTIPIISFCSVWHLDVNYSLKLLLGSITAIYTTYYVITIFNNSCSASNHYHDKTRQIHHQYSRLAIQSAIHIDSNAKHAL